MSKDDEEVDVSWVQPQKKEQGPGWPGAFATVSLGILLVICWLGTLWIRR